ncbi:GNAT family N-acetyltransferase [Spirosoma sp. KUDC1026]|nr:GNAT family N-acetyltransferase [Spirosoma sp. KUDC1026]
MLVVNQATQQIVARCAFFIKNEKAISPGAAPFGSVEFDEYLPDDVLEVFVNQLFTEAKLAGCRMLTLVHYPRCYAPSQTDRLLTLLQASGCSLIKSHPTFYLPITNRSFAQDITASERRRLRKCRRGNFQFAHWQQYDSAIVINFLLDTYAQLSYQLSLPPEQLLHLLATFPDQFLVFTLRDDAQLIALTITVRVRHDILYNFLPASLPAYHAFSPMVMLLDGVYAYCQRETISLLDLGMALDSTHQPKASLARFKQNLGAKESPKYVFRKAL